MVDVPANTGSLLTQKAGPLPMWGWGVVILGGAYGWKLYTNRKGGAQRDEAAGPSAAYLSANLPSNIQPQFTTVLGGANQSYVNSPVTTVGRQYIETGATGVVTSNTYPGTVVTPTPVTAPDPPRVTPPGAVAPIPQPPAAPGQFLTVVKWNARDRNAPSTLTGLSLKAYGNASAWQKIWNAPQNADLVRRRGNPAKIQPGDRFFAPA